MGASIRTESCLFKFRICFWVCSMEPIPSRGRTKRTFLEDVLALNSTKRRCVPVSVIWFVSVRVKV